MDSISHRSILISSLSRLNYHRQNMQVSNGQRTIDLSRIDAVGTFPSLPCHYIRELQEEDGVISRFLAYWKLQRKTSRTERQTESKQVLRLLREWDRIREIDGLLYRHTVDRFRGKIDQLLPTCCTQQCWIAFTIV